MILKYCISNCSLCVSLNCFLISYYLLLTAAPKLNVPPRFRDTAFFDKGENVVVKIPFTGFPKPKISWYRGEEKIESGGHYHVEVKVSAMQGCF